MLMAVKIKTPVGHAAEPSPGQNSAFESAAGTESYLASLSNHA